MTHRRLARFAACTATLCGVMVVPVASASVASIKAAIVSYSPKIDVAEGHVLTAVGEYQQSHDPAGVEAAISGSVAVLSSLKADIARQSARAPRAKKAKARIESGLQVLIVAYGDLSTAYAEEAANPGAATTEAMKAEVLVKKGRKDLSEGLKLLR